MTAAAQARRPRRWWVRWLLAPVAGLILLVLLGLAVPPPLLLVVFALLFGWLRFGYLALSAMQPNWTLVAEAAICTATVALGGHWFLAWLYRASAAGAPRVWRLRWTAAGLAMLALMFVIGISLIGVTHQTVWLMSSKKTWFRSNWDGLWAGAEAIKLSEPQRAQISAYYRERRLLPKSTEELFGAAVVPLQGELVRSMTIHFGGRIRFQFDDARLDGETFELYPAGFENGEILWACKGTFQRMPSCGG